ncbi:MAG: helix-turn-helix transcriptional regulator [Anaerolineales bacterium]|jgi:transcriptional regulator with XRE-family HTH domain
MNENETIKNFVIQKAQERKLSLRKVAAGIGIGSSHLSAILNGKRPISVDVCNAIADFFDTQRVELYNMIGWLTLDEDEELIDRIREYSKKNPEFNKFVKTILETKDENERKRIMRVLRAALGK